MQVLDQRFSLYIHIPYCISKCPYCDFNSHVVAEIPERAYTDAIVREIDYYATSEDWSGKTIQTVFFGGGTPSTFHPESFGKMLEEAATQWHFASDCEITLEANPGTVDRVNFFGYRGCGVNRISVGVQSFQPQLLKFLGRVHSSDEAKKALTVVREAGFENFSLDLIYANPAQTLSDLERDLETAVSFQSPHLSAYNLTIEEGTPFYHEFRAGRLSSLSEDEEIAMAQLIEGKLSEAGLERYEISNYARRGFHSRHNVNYWRGGNYLGIGAGAHSYAAPCDGAALGHRWSNEKNPGRYLAEINRSGHAVTDREAIELQKAAGEFMFLGLRMTEGISKEQFQFRFKRSPAEFYPQIADWTEAGLIEEQADCLRLSRRGLLVANSIFVNFL